MDCAITITYIVMILLGLFELYQTFKFYKWDKKAKKVPTAPAAIFFSGYIGTIFVIAPLLFVSGSDNLKLERIFYIIIGICVMVAALLIFRRGYQMARKLKKYDSNIQVVQVCFIAFVLFITGFLNLFK